MVLIQHPSDFQSQKLWPLSRWSVNRNFLISQLVGLDEPLVFHKRCFRPRGRRNKIVPYLPNRVVRLEMFRYIYSLLLSGPLASVHRSDEYVYVAGSPRCLHTVYVDTKEAGSPSQEKNGEQNRRSFLHVQNTTSCWC